MAEGCEQQIWRFFEEQNGQVVIYDANNGTRAARHALAEKFDKKGIHVILLGKYSLLTYQFLFESHQNSRECLHERGDYRSEYTERQNIFS